ncbi:uncharacterized protein BJ171DRAFT_623715 [Polychytrium aggregatum]|uniref:uncharacterized protein n=1 Tax=Polychytrium aggregatum TaxID=110093 RepID=UPI0022FDBF5C|nr:uncharacterized protein BJ171DRAFT_623715 [Polychytrium aggregatum]KAI9203452.1 hypothetical protein BJ171DRAFT_623715 [Polychytrium aggregatum]
MHGSYRNIHPGAINTSCCDDLPGRSAAEVGLERRSCASTESSENASPNAPTGLWLASRFGTHQPILSTCSSGESSSATQTAEVDPILPKGGGMSGPRRPLLKGQRPRFIKFGAVRTLRHLGHFTTQSLRSRFFFCVGASSSCLLVFSLTFILALLTITPLVYLSIGEFNDGENDLIVSQTGDNRINYTLLSSLLLQFGSEYSYSTPRYHDIQFQVYYAPSCGLPSPPSGPSKQFSQCVLESDSCLGQQCTSPVWVHSFILDSDREKDLGIGRTWALGALQKNQVYIGARLAQRYGASVGDTLYVALDYRTLFPVLMTRVTSQLQHPLNQTALDQLSSRQVLNVPFVISAIYDEDASSKIGRWPPKEFMMIMELSPFMDSIVPYLPASLPAAFTQQFRQAALLRTQYEQITNVIFSCAIPRVSCYESADFYNIAQDLVSWASSLSFIINATLQLQYDYQLHLLTPLHNASMLSGYLQLFFTFILVLLVALAFFLLNTNLAYQVEARTFHSAVLRLMGMGRSGLVSMTLTGSLSAALPGWILGMLVSQAVYMCGRVAMNSFIGINPPVVLPTECILLGTCAGLVMPVLAALAPTARAWSQTIVGSLYISRFRISSMSKRSRSSHGHSSLLRTNTILATLISITCFMVYIYLPMSFAQNDTNTTTLIMWALMLAVLAGLLALSLNVQIVLESLILHLVMLFAFAETRIVRQIAQKNLLAHRSEHRSTSLTLSFALSFIIFLLMSFQVQITMMETSPVQKYGAPLSVLFDPPVHLGDLEALDAFSTSNGKALFEVAYQTAPLDTLVPMTLIQNPGGVVAMPVSVQGISAGFLTIGEPSVLEFGQVRDGRSVDQIGGMLGSSGLPFMPCVLSSFLSDSLRCTAGEEDRPCALLSLNGSSTKIALSPVAFLDSGYCGSFTKYPTSNPTSVFVSMASFLNLSRGRVGSLEQMSIQTALIRPTDLSSSTSIRQSLSSYLPSGGSGATIVDLQDEVSTLETAKTILDILFYSIAGIVVLMAMFSLNTAMWASVQNQSKEIAVLMAIGLGKWALTRIYFYEGYTVVLAAIFSGTALGTCVGYGIVGSWSTITGTHILVPFPFWIVLVALGVALVFVMASIASPIYRIIWRSQIVHNLR